MKKPVKDVDDCKDPNKAEKDEPTNSKLEGVPIDRGWAWVILAGSVLYVLIFGGVMRSYGVFFLKFQERFHAKASEVAVMSLIQNIVTSITGLLVMTIGLKKMSCRTMVAIGGALFVIAHIVSGLATDIGVLYLSHGVVSGLGVAMIFPPILGIIGIYFNKHRGLANSVVTGSAAVGALIFAPVVTTLFESYGYTGAMIFVGGMLLHSFVTAALLRPPEWFTKRNKKGAERDMKEVEEPLLDGSNPIDKTKLKVMDKNEEQSVKGKRLEFEMEQADGNRRTYKNGVSRHMFMERANSFHPDIQSSPVLTRVRAWSHGNKRIRTVSENSATSTRSHSKLNSIVAILDNSKSALYASGEGIFGSVISVQSPVIGNKDSGMKPESITEETCCISLKLGVIDIVSTIFDCTLLKNIVFIQYLAMAFVTISGMVMVPIFIPTYARDTGVSYDKIAIILSASACTDIISKITSGIIADRKWIRRTTMLGVAAFAVGTLCHLARFFTNFPLIAGLSIVMACFYSLYNAMFATILIECIGLEKFQSSLGFTTLIHGVSIAIFFPVAGLIRDVYGSYIYSLHMCGILAYIGSVLLLLLPMVQKRVEAKKASKGNIAV